MAHDFWIAIHGEGGAEWKRITGTNHFPVTSCVPVKANLPGLGESEVYLLALRELNTEVRERIIEHLAAKFHLDPEETRKEIAAAGIPILAQDCTVILHNPLRWI